MTLPCHRPIPSLVFAYRILFFFFRYCFFLSFALCFYSYHLLLAMRDVPPVSFSLLHLYFNEKSLISSFPFFPRTPSTIVHHDTKKKPYIFLSLSDLPSSLSTINTTSPQVLASPLHHIYISLFPPHSLAPYHPHFPSLTPFSLPPLPTPVPLPCTAPTFWQIIFEHLSLVYVLYESEINVSFP